MFTLSFDFHFCPKQISDSMGLPVPLTPFGVKITSEVPVDLEALSRVTEDFLDEYFKDQLPKLGYPHYNNVALSAAEAKRRQRSLRARSLEALEQEITISGNVNFEEEPLPDTQLLDNLRDAVFAGQSSKDAYLDALRSSDDPGLQSATAITVYEGDSEYIPSLSERTQPGANTGGDDDGNGVRSYVIAAIAGLSFVVFGTALFLYNRKQMRDRGGDMHDKDGLMSEFSEEASDAVLIKDDLDLGSSDSLDKLPSIEPEPISLIRDAKTLERAMIRSNYNRSLIEKANERVERKATVMPDDDGDDDSKTISFAETIAKSLSPQSQSPRTKSLMWMLGKGPESNESNEGENDTSPKGDVDPPAGQTQMVLVHRPDKYESPSSNLMDDVSLGSPSDFSRALVARSPSPAPTSYTPTIELPPAPISITMEKYSPNHQQSAIALTEGNPSTPFSLVTSGVESTHDVVVPKPSPNGRSGVEIVIEDYRKPSPRNNTPSPSHTPRKKRSGLASLLGIAAHPYATVKPTEQEPMSP